MKLHNAPFPTQRFCHDQPAAGSHPLRHRSQSAQATLKRSDIYGKTGTTNDAMDAWFAGYQPNLGRGGLDRLRHPRKNWATAKPVAA